MPDSQTAESSQTYLATARERVGSIAPNWMMVQFDVAQRHWQALPDYAKPVLTRPIVKALKVGAQDPDWMLRQFQETERRWETLPDYAKPVLTRPIVPA